jgi:four helix bundle protein
VPDAEAVRAATRPPHLVWGRIVQSFRELKVWQRSHAFVLAVYRLSEAFPSQERFGVVSQLRRAAVSVPTNIAEGSKRRTSQDYARFLNLAEASLAETEYLLMLCRDLGYIASELTEPLLVEASEISRMLYALRGKVEQGGPAE